MSQLVRVLLEWDVSHWDKAGGALERLRRLMKGPGNEHICQVVTSPLQPQCRTFDTTA